MGGNLSQFKEVSKNKLENKVNLIATKYILKQNFEDLKNLSKEETCNDLVILTSELIDKHFKGVDINYLADKKGINKKETVITVSKKDWDKIGNQNSEEKTEMCTGLAKYYVQIANIFAVISTTIDPTKNITDGCGNIIYQDSKESLCSKRLMSLLHNIDYKLIQESIDKNIDHDFIINPDFCKMNCEPCPNQGKYLNSEAGIPELKHLYFDKYESGEFKRMSNSMSKIYQKDVEIFYKAFSGNDIIPKDKNGLPLITNFSDIKLKDFYNSVGCINDNYKTPAEGSLKNQLFKNYANNIQEMILSSEKQYKNLLKILKKIFIDTTDKKSKKRIINIKPNLQQDELDDIIKETRETILKLYTNCEIHFTKGIEIYQSLADHLYLNQSKNILNEPEEESEEESEKPKEEVKEEPTEELKEEPREEPTKEPRKELTEELIEELIEEPREELTEELIEEPKEEVRKELIEEPIPSTLSKGRTKKKSSQRVRFAGWSKSKKKTSRKKTSRKKKTSKKKTSRKKTS